jgi:transposase
VRSLGGCATGWVEDLAVEGEALGRSRGGLTSKIHLAVDGRGLPMSIILTPGQAGDNPQLLPLLDQIAVGRDGPGRPRRRPERVLADKAYSHPSTRAALRSRGIAFTSPEKSDQIARRKAKGSRRGRPPAFDPERYADRNVVERCFNRLKRFPRPGHPLRQAGRLLPVRDRHCRDRVVAACRLTRHARILTLGSMWCMTRSTSRELIGPPRSSCGRARCQLRMCA